MGTRLIGTLVERAGELAADLEKEFEKCLHDLEVTPRALNLTHEVIEKCANALDQLMHLAWEIRIAPTLGVSERPRGYFPAAIDEQSFRSALGQWKLVDVEQKDPVFAKVLRRWQPLSDPQNNWIAMLRKFAAKKHVGLVPQKIQSEPRVVVSDQRGNSVSWGPGVTFGQGVSVFGAPIDPKSQLPVETPGVEARVEIWVRFHIEGTDLNALSFCTECVSGTKLIIANFASELVLPD
ncbi:hypothetical protein [Dongia deserti]|uniref:hypothetical protein n=1 Tax=Dongia deserti TaxID=2268030 RepID=UPI000E64CD67|nr:hypothetical protein [Dongia deserti]